MAADNYVLDDVDKEEINVTVVDPNYGSQLLEFIIDDGKNEAADVETGGDWSDVKPEEYKQIETDLPGEKRAGISAGGGSPCLQPGATTPVNANETATSATDTEGGGADTGGGGADTDGASDVPKGKEIIPIVTVPNLDASGQGSSGEYLGRKFTNLKTKTGWWVSPIKKKVVKFPAGTIVSTWTVAIEAWAIFTNLFYDIHNEVEDINLKSAGQNEGSLYVREIKDGNFNPGWLKGDKIITKTNKKTGVITSETKTYKGEPRWSNHASGTGVDMNTHLHPYQAMPAETRGFNVKQIAKLTEILNRYNGAVKGGYTYDDDMHFEITKKPDEFAKIIKGLPFNVEQRAAAIAAGALKFTSPWAKK